MINIPLHKTNIKWLMIRFIIFFAASSSYAQANNQKVQKMTMENLIDSVNKVTGEEYLAIEAQIRQGGSKAVSRLKTKLNDSDAFTRIYAKTMIEWIEGRSLNNTAALTYLDTLPEKLSRTPITSPPPTGVASYLSLHFQSSVTNILAIHLIKLPELPYWRAIGILFYFEEQKAYEIIDILLRIISENRTNDWNDYVVGTIDAINDPQLHSKILQEETRLKSLELTLPQSLKDRLSKYY